MTVVVPIIWIVITCVGMAITKKYGWGRVPLYFLPLVNLSIIWLQVGRVEPDYFFLCLSMAAVSGIVWAFLIVSRDDDLLFKRYLSQMAVILGLFTTIWWVGALIGFA
ncbi:hypothetical protein [Lacticaseibacillus hulanensis]|uniref:hypothetical protein n=1 Tax=Lacticaseibacillus hulanensis TaxID=2493111 RepID=UPI000FDA9CA9|nr:hypothetical protein [Lacticaseibacillus hulanensis]